MNEKDALCSEARQRRHTAYRESELQSSEESKLEKKNLESWRDYTG